MNLPISSSLLFLGFVFSFKTLRLNRPLTVPYFYLRRPLLLKVAKANMSLHLSMFVPETIYFEYMYTCVNSPLCLDFRYLLRSSYHSIMYPSEGEACIDVLVFSPRLLIVGISKKKEVINAVGVII